MMKREATEFQSLSSLLIFFPCFLSSTMMIKEMFQTMNKVLVSAHSPETYIEDLVDALLLAVKAVGAGWFHLGQAYPRVPASLD